MWNGAAASLKRKPTTKKRIPTTNRLLYSIKDKYPMFTSVIFINNLAKISKLVVPANP